MNRPLATLSEQANALREAHYVNLPLILVNIWDVASARQVEQEGFPFLATSSSAIAKILGEQDTNSMDPALAFSVVRRIVDGTSRPVTADIEAGYRLTPKDLARTLIDVGAVGCNIEDSDHRSGGLIPAEEQATRIEELKQEAQRIGVDIVVNARIDTIVRSIGNEAEQLEEAIRRAQLYAQAGADCVYPIMLKGKDRIAKFVAAVGLPVNINVRPGSDRVVDLVALGVSRFSFAGGIFRYTQLALTRILEQLAVDADALTSD